MAHLLERSAIKPVLVAARLIVVVGIHDEKSRAAYYVPEYLSENGYRVIGVNPGKAGLELFGEPVRASLAEIHDPVDIIDIFRRGSAVTEYTDAILAMSPLPKVVWLQLGIRNQPFADAMVSAGIDVVQDRCTLAEIFHICV